ncbi:hypothetical protein ACQEVG_17150 [Streptomyces sp. CA-135486]|uniref:hypothetical protein n=1 Tax=Streptomyces sp. CA-135486 TaxID=3240049 RepID=UPI003D8F3DFF
MRRTTDATPAEMTATVAAFLTGRRGGTGPAPTPARSRRGMATTAREIKPTRVNSRARRTP